MNKTKVLRIFDLDETFFRMPGYTSKKSAETEELSFSHPYDFYDHPVSLCERLHNIQMIKPVYEDWKQSQLDPEHSTVLITHRVEELRGTVTEILEKRGVKFDQMFFLGRIRSKAEVLAEIIESLPDLEEVLIYEDSIQQLSIYQNLAEELKIKSNRRYPDFKFYIVDKSKVYRIQGIQLSEEKRITLL